MNVVAGYDVTGAEVEVVSSVQLVEETAADEAVLLTTAELELRVGYDPATDEPAPAPAPDEQEGPLMLKGKLYWKVAGSAVEVILIP